MACRSRCASKWITNGCTSPTASAPLRGSGCRSRSMPASCRTKPPHPVWPTSPARSWAWPVRILPGLRSRRTSIGSSTRSETTLQMSPRRPALLLGPRKLDEMAGRTLMLGRGECGRKWRGALVLTLVAVAMLEAQGPTPLYRQVNAPIDARVSDLLSQMTLEEKVAQLVAIWNRKRDIQGAQGRFDPVMAQAIIGDGIGQVARPSEIAGGGSRPAHDAASFVNAVQKWLIENTRLGIPAMFHEEALHGLVAPGGTHFPVPIGLASTWDPPLIERLMSVAALEARARGVHHVLSPVVDLGRDPRWGRIEETFGEDPYLVTRMGVAAVRGYQGTSLPLAADKVLATLKHFAGHGSTKAASTPRRRLSPSACSASNCWCRSKRR